jgi:adenylylsulfate kinase
MKLKKHRAACLWFTGLSGSGKSSLASEIESILFDKNVHTFLLDGDNIRHGLNKDLGFSDSDRHENIRRLAEVSKLFVEAGLVVITAAISPFRKDRDFARSLFEPNSFFEIFVKCPLEICQSRDPKGLYAKADSNQITQLTGIQSPYEEPLNPELILLNDKSKNFNENVYQVISLLIKNKIIS